MRYLAVIIFGAAIGCGEPIGDRGGDAGAAGGDTATGGDDLRGDDLSGSGDDAQAGDALGGDSPLPGDTTIAGCPLGEACNPIQIPTFPYTDSRDTAFASSDAIDTYACAPTTDESGNEVFYSFTLAAAGVVTAHVTDGIGVDVDIHLLAATDGASCLARDHTDLGRRLDAGTYYLVVDTWVNGGGTPQAGPYTLSVYFFPLVSGACAMTPVDMEMRWSGGCDGRLDCFAAGGVFLRTPAFGPMAKEAHLVTNGDGFGSAWPQTIIDGIPNHYVISAATSCYAAARSEPWAPQESSEFGQGAGGAPLPVLDEAWYVNMYWMSRPARGTRMLVINPQNGRAVVAAGGYETGPGSNTAIGGAVEEIHDYLGTSHLSQLIMGFAVDPTLPLGPFDCAAGVGLDPCQ